ncbi:MAG: hypothetical protein JWR20_2405, partial [Marmoricola sp.]|nr:hypothetical protein [Marmoricola sp.]
MTTTSRAPRTEPRPEPRSGSRPVTSSASGSVTGHPTGSGVGIAIALVSAASFATSGSFAKGLLETGWTPGSVTFLRVAGAAAVLLVPT